MIELRPVEVSDLESFYEFQSDPEAVAMAVFGSRDRASHFEVWTTKIMVNPDGLARTVLVDGVVAGNMLSWSSDGVRYVGYWIGREFWGRGVATEALGLFVREIPERPIYGLVVISNVGSQRVLEKNAFVRLEQRPSPDDDIEEFVYRLD
ncbi:MAG TPA: GNAT family N-acetyltransferase [Candidatus Limnocylindrales bacterium]|nr:GNAT family N-acetyltransferase [Candidatus Limnocylindrales bacterium]